MDAQLLFGEAIDVGSTSAAASVISTNNVYIPKVTDHLGSSQNDRPNVSGDLHLNVVVEDEVAAGSGGTSAVTINLANSTAAITNSNLASADTLLSTVISADASGSNYPDGTQVCSIPLPTTILKEYFAVGFTVATKALATGKFTAWIGNAIQQGGEHGAL